MSVPSQPIRGHYSPDEAARIQREILTEGVQPTCPRCGRTLTSTLPMGGRCSRHEVWELHCESCQQCVVVDDTMHA